MVPVNVIVTEMLKKFQSVRLWSFKGGKFQEMLS